jgi:hypothetical protein
MKRWNRSGQVTIFIIIAVIIVSVIVTFFIFKSGLISKIGGKPEENPAPFLESCIKDKVKEAVGILSMQGGYISNTLYKKFRFEDENVFHNISYLCYTPNYYLPCVNQEPLLIQHLKDEIKDYISEDVSGCFDKLTSSLNKRGYTVDAKYNGFDVDLTEGRVIINVDAKLVLTKTGETSTQENFNIIIPTDFYDMAVVAQEIVSQEARFCYFEYVGYMNLYPQWNIDKIRTSDSVTIYTIEDKETQEKFRFAVRGCVIPPGF